MFHKLISTHAIFIFKAVLHTSGVTEHKSSMYRGSMYTPIGI